MIELDCSVENDDWGEIGASSFIGQLLKSQNRAVDESTPYASLWMGIHDSDPSRVTHLSPEFDTKPIHSVLKAWPEFVGDVNIATKYGFKLPILTKVLSIMKPTPLQINMSEKRKPKLLYTLSNCELLCGFRPSHEIVDNLRKFDYLKELIALDPLEDYVETNGEVKQTLNPLTLRLFIHTLRKCMSRPKTELDDFMNSICRTDPKDYELLNLLDLMRKGGISSLISYFFLNYVKLSSDQVITINSDLHHVYLNGNYLELSDPSDYVMREPEIMEDIMIRPYPNHVGFGEPVIINPSDSDTFLTRFTPEPTDWIFDVINGNKKGMSIESEYVASSTSSGSFILFLGPTQATLNNVYQLKPGQIFFTPPGLTLRFSHLTGPFRLFRISMKP